ncbi:Na+/H+ antiporter subunit A [Brevibacterium daeguense]|uniref:Na+/H+ antiporter subunit A n=2 Tax=Brevibacterium daeguense TaxID=909936 RepID=A0ABP8EHY6_9MICO
MVSAFFVAALLVSPLFRLLGRNAFLVLALVPAAAFVMSLVQIPHLLSGDPPWIEHFSWLPALNMQVVFLMDPLAWVMTLLVAGVGAFIFIYCARYFDDDEPRLVRFAGVLMGFAGMMYGLVLADEMLTLFIFWEGTTVFSYLLIGQYNSRQQSRRAALQSLVVTTFGGLAMLVGMIMLSEVMGTGRISAIVDAGFSAGPDQAFVIVAVMLILVGAVSKSALIPFHFWLPGAMAAPTPVSAYLHAAAMVKAGIYLVFRMAPGFHTMPGWTAVLLTLGIATMLVGGWQALRQFDLKLVLAYGTVSQLGFLTIVGTFGTRDVTQAALTLLLAHALFKSALFLIVGIIDHRAGTRDLRKLSGYGRRSPILLVTAIIAAASMAGIPPTLGFVAKEAVYTTLLEDGTKSGIVALIGVFLGSVFTVAYSARFVWGAFAVKPGVEPLKRARESSLFKSAPVILTAFTLLCGLGANLLDPVFAAWTSGLPSEGGEPYHIALWHGLEPALLLSALTIALGLTMFWFGRQVSAFQAEMPAGINFHNAYRRTITGLESLAAYVTARTQRGSMPFYQGVIYVVFIGTLATALLLNETWPSDIDFVQGWPQILVAVCMILASLAATRADKRFAAVVIVGIAGYSMVVFFAIQGAPDLALTQMLVETITIVVFILVLRRLPSRMGQAQSRLTPALRGVIAVLFGIIMMIVAFVALGARVAEPVSELFPFLAYEYGHGQNVVNVTLVDIRVWDTVGELSVVVVAATGVASLIFVRGREGVLPRYDMQRPGGLSRFQPVEDEFHTPLRVVEPNSDSEHGRNAWLLAGRTLSPSNRSILLEVLVRILFHVILVFSVYLLFAGHNLPGGGFAAGLVAGLALIARYLAGGRYELAEAAPIDAGRVLGVGIALAAGTGIGGYIWGDTIFRSEYWSAEVPILGDLSFGTSTVFDIGVYLVVIGLMLDILRSLGAEVDRHQEADQERLAETLISDTSFEGPDSRQLHAILGRMDDVEVDGRAGGSRL